MTSFDANKSTDFYKIIKSSYELKKYEIIDISGNEIKILKFLKKVLNLRSNLDFTFMNEYVDSCKFYYYIKTESDAYFIITHNKMSAKDKNLLLRTVSRVAIIKNLYNIIKNFKFFIMMYPHRRYLPENSENFQAKHINGGFTIKNTNDIFIIRKENYDKVIIHELLHHTILDIDDWSYYNIKMLKDKFNISKNCILLPSEAIIEAYACLLHIAFCAVENGYNFRKLLKLDHQHSLKIAKKIISFQNHKKVWYEETNIYCYTIIKSIIYLNFDKFLKINAHQNDITNFILDYSKSLYRKMKNIQIHDNKNFTLTVI
jgi:hypothetical protein